jgi:hypothetical protein
VPISCGKTDSQIWLCRRWVEKARAHGVCRCGGPGGEIELAQNARDVTMDCVLAHEETVGYLPVREAFGKAA